MRTDVLGVAFDDVTLDEAVDRALAAAETALSFAPEDARIQKNVRLIQAALPG